MTLLVVLVLQESESDTSDLDLGYYEFLAFILHHFMALCSSAGPETQAIPAIFEFLKEEASVAGK